MQSCDRGREAGGSAKYTVRRADDSVRDSICVKGIPKEKIRAMTSPCTPSKGEENCRVSVCKKAIADFKKLKPEAHYVADLMVFFVE